MDLYHGQDNEIIGEWESVKKLPDISCCKLKVKLTDDSEIFTYFYSDKAIWVQKYGIKPSYFWECKSKEPIYNVKEWKMMRRSL